MNLAEQFRPHSLEEFIGQNHLTSSDSPFMKNLHKATLRHSFFFGPPGCGKTTFARLIATYLQKEFFEFNATTVKIDDIRNVVSRFRHTLFSPVIFIDEVHRLNKTQQEVLLPMMEKDEALFLGASTENPFFTLTNGIRSRSFVYPFYPLEYRDLDSLFQRVHKTLSFNITLEAKDYLLHSSNGDARQMLLLLDALRYETTITLEMIKFFRPASLNETCASDDTHYNLTSALIKSIRGSDVDASIYWLARLIKGGESAEFIARRLVILASEDIGNANPDALPLAVACMQSVAKIGFPEARIPLAQTTIYLACSPKSNSAYVAINRALEAIDNGLNLPVPTYLQDSHTLTAQHHSIPYHYPHDFGGWVQQNYLPEHHTFVEFKPIAFEERLHNWLLKIKS